MIKTRYSLLFFFVLLLTSIPFLVLAYAEYSSTRPEQYFFIHVFGPVLMAGLSICFPVLYFKRAPRIILTDEFIRFSNLFRWETYKWSSIQEVALSRSEDFKLFIFMGFRIESTVLIF